MQCISSGHGPHSRRSEDRDKKHEAKPTGRDTEAQRHSRTQRRKEKKFSLSISLLLSLLADESVALGEDALLSPLASSAGLGAFGVHLLLEHTLTLLLSLGLVDL